MENPGGEDEFQINDQIRNGPYTKKCKKSDDGDSLEEILIISFITVINILILHGNLNSYRVT